MPLLKTFINKEAVKSKIFNIVAKLDNGSHSSNQLQGVDEALTELFTDSLHQYNTLVVERVENYIKENRDKVERIDRYILDNIIKVFKEE